MYNVGTKSLLPLLLCGDLNSTPHSHFLDFVRTSAIDYSKLSAVAIAGFYPEEKCKSKRRAIPVPLFPQMMNIGPDCTYRRVSDKSGSGPTCAADRNEKRSSDKGRVSTNQQQRSDGRSAEFTEADMDDSMIQVPNYPMRTTHSVRGAKARGLSGRGNFTISEVRSGSRRGKVEQQVDDARSSWKYPTTSSSGSSAMDEDFHESSISRGCLSKSRGSVTEESATNSLKSSSPSSQSKSKHTPLNGRVEKEMPPSLNHKHNGHTESNPGGVLTHPFKLLSAYPHSKSHPSTVTTYHRLAFETVDYIFYSPVAYKAAGTKKQVTGFNLLKRKVLPSTHTLLDLGPQPHQFLSSDHLLLQATFQFAW